MIKVAVTTHVSGNNQDVGWFEMPEVPTVGSTIYFDDWAWRVEQVYWIPDAYGLVPTPKTTTWHAKIDVSR